jgi:hypothetical protein
MAELLKIFRLTNRWCYPWLRSLMASLRISPPNHSTHIHSDEPRFSRFSRSSTFFRYVLYCILLLTVRVIPSATLPNLNIREKLSSVTSIPRSSNLAAQVAGVNYNPNGSAFLWLPQDDYSGSTFFE